MNKDNVTTMWECDLMEKMYLCGLDDTQDLATIKAWRSSYSYYWRDLDDRILSTQVLNDDKLKAVVIKIIRGMINGK